MLIFLALAGWSCYWTAISFFRWNPSITIFGAWLLAGVIYLLASLAFAQLLNTLDKHKPFYGTPGRTGWFVISLVVFVTAWLVLSLPTNTHTLLYNVAVKNELLTDLQRTQGYLNDLQNNNRAILQIAQDYQDIEDRAKRKLTDMNNEMQRYDNPGIAEHFNAHLSELENILTIDPSHPVEFPRIKVGWNDKHGCQRAYDQYKNATHSYLSIIQNSAVEEAQRVLELIGTQDLQDKTEKINTSLEEIRAMDAVDDNLIANAEKALDAAYPLIKTNAQYIDFRDNDALIYTGIETIPTAKALHNVPGVWTDFFTTDKYSNYGIIWWVLIALIVDLAGFVFFKFAFSKK